MLTLERCYNVLNTMKSTIYNYEFKLTSRLSSKYFSRERKMNFQDTMLCLLNYFRKNAQIEIESFLRNVKESKITMSEQAFLKARSKISPAAFTKLNEVLVQSVYENENYYKKFRGYRLLAVDGSILSLNNTEAMRKAFGYVENSTSKIAKAQASCLYDIENGVILHSIIDNYRTSEHKMAIEHINALEMLGYRNDLLLFDRGYPSTDLISCIMDKGLTFLMRVSSHFLEQINDFKEDDGIVHIRLKNKVKEIRILNVVLDTGEVEKLISNITDSSFNANDFKQLYFKRWEIETRYDFLKNKLEIENFTGNTELIVLQDFYASIYLSNLYEMIKACSDEAIENENQSKSLKYKYQTSQKRLVSKLKDNLIKIVIEENDYFKQQMLDDLISQIKMYALPKIPERSFSRKKNSASIKFSMNKKLS